MTFLFRNVLYIMSFLLTTYWRIADQPRFSSAAHVSHIMLCRISICYGNSLRQSHSWSVSKWLNVSSNFVTTCLPIILIFPCQTSWKGMLGSLLNTCGIWKIYNIWPLSSYILETVQDTHIVTMENRFVL